MKVYECMQDTMLRKHASSRVTVSVQGVKSLGDYFACLCQDFNFCKVKEKKVLTFFKKKGEMLSLFNHLYCEKSSKRAKLHKFTTMTPNLPE